MTKNALHLIVATSALFCLKSAFAQQLEAPPGPDACLPEAGAEFVCGQAAVEDMVYLPGRDWVLADARRGNEGGIRVVGVRDRKITTIYPSATAKERLDRKSYPDCPGPPSDADKAKFVSHGLALTPVRRNQYKLYVVHHGERESVEVFDFDARGRIPSVTWVGCAIAPGMVGLNSVVGLPGGGFIATNFQNRAPPGARAEGAAARPPGPNMRAGEKNGELWEWQTETGWVKVPGSEASGANGVEVSKDGRTLYVAEWGSQSFFRLSRGTHPPKIDSIPLGFRVDNVHWAPDGSLLAAGQYTDLNGSRAVKIDPGTLQVTTLVDQPRTPGFVPASVAVEVGKEIWLGLSIGSHRIAILPAPVVK